MEEFSLIASALYDLFIHSAVAFGPLLISAAVFACVSVIVKVFL